MVKILHTADCHLGSPISGLTSAASAVRRQQLESAFSDMLKKASELSVDVMLISGDLFDNEYAAPSTVKRLNDFALENKDIRIVIAPGNHDCIMGNKCYASLSAENITVFNSGEIERVDIPRLNLTIYGIGNINPHSERRYLRDFYVDDVSRINIMCCHGLITGQGGHTPYNPITREDMAGSGLDYIALGHVHAYSGIEHLGSVSYAYPGCILGRGFDEQGEKGYIIGSIDKGTANLNFVKSDYPSFRRVYVDCTDSCDMTEVISRAQTACENIPDADFVSVVLDGRVKSELVINRTVVKDALRRFSFIKVADKTLPRLDYMEMVNEQTLKGLFIRSVLESGLDEAEAQKAISIGLAALCGEELNMDEY